MSDIELLTIFLGLPVGFVIVRKLLPKQSEDALGRDKDCDSAANDDGGASRDNTHRNKRDDASSKEDSRRAQSRMFSCPVC